jgi:hypothetical protein
VTDHEESEPPSAFGCRGFFDITRPLVATLCPATTSGGDLTVSRVQRKRAGRPSSVLALDLLELHHRAPANRGGPHRHPKWVRSGWLPQHLPSSGCRRFLLHGQEGVWIRDSLPSSSESPDLDSPKSPRQLPVLCATVRRRLVPL